MTELGGVEFNQLRELADSRLVDDVERAMDGILPQEEDDEQRRGTDER